MLSQEKALSPILKRLNEKYGAHRGVAFVREFEFYKRVNDDPGFTRELFDRLFERYLGAVGG